MRPIDADAVFPWYVEAFKGNIKPNEIRFSMYDIEWNLINIPTIVPERKSGKWINHRNDNGHNIADCDQCGHAIQWFDGDETPKYCCMCGSYNGGEQE